MPSFKRRKFAYKLKAGHMYIFRNCVRCCFQLTKLKTGKCKIPIKIQIHTTQTAVL